MDPMFLMYNQFSKNSDIWSIGVMYYKMLYGKLPWTGGSK
jgi:serine/threonine protein kinase